MNKNNETGPMKLDIVVPCFNEEDVLPTTITQLGSTLRELVNEGLVADDSQVIFIDDGSSDATWALIQAAAESDPHMNGLRLARNSGHQNALLAGLEYSDAELTLSIDADLQDDIGVIKDMVRSAIDGHDVVYGIRGDRNSDTRFKRFTAESYYRFLAKLGVEVIENHADFRLMHRSAVKRLLQYQEANLYLRGIVPLVGHSTDSVYYKRLPRQAGETKYPLKKMISLAVHGVTSFSAVPLRFISALGLAVFVMSFLMGAWVLWVRIFTEAAMPGWASTLLPMFFLGGIQLLSLGIIGEYIANIYMESKRRPRYFVETTARSSSTE